MTIEQTGEAGKTGETGETVEDALGSSTGWLQRADGLARTLAARKFGDTATLVQSYAAAADVWVRIAELRAALDGRIVPAVETYDQRHVAETNSLHRSEAEGEFDAAAERAFGDVGKPRVL